MREGSVGFGKLTDRVTAEIKQNQASGDPHYAGANWGIIDRNTIGNGDAYLRAGPSAAGEVAPPQGFGSLGLRTGSGSDKAAFGNQVDFAGDKLADVDTVKYSIFTTAENGNVNVDNLPNIAVEVDPDSSTEAGSNYSTLVYVPKGDEKNENKWSEHDASKEQRWYLTGTAGTTAKCDQATYCTLDEVKKALPNASIYTVAISKGRDSAFSGAVDALVWDDTTYDFEPLGVKVVS